MKAAIELFRDYAISTLFGVESKLMNLKMFREALAEHDKEIKDLIDEIDLEYYETVVSTQNHSDILRAELSDLIDELWILAPQKIIENLKHKGHKIETVKAKGQKYSEYIYHPEQQIELRF